MQVVETEVRKLAVLERLCRGKEDAAGLASCQIEGIVVDLVDSGRTLNENGLVEIEHIADITSRFIVNRAALKTQPERIGRWVDRFREISRAA